MASVCVICSKKLKKHYVGSCINLEERLLDHNNGVYKNSFTKVANDWVIIFQLNDLTEDVSRKIEKHIKNMKSIKYYDSLIKYPEISQNLIAKYSG